MSHSCNHDDHHHESGPGDRSQSKLMVVLGLVFVYFVAEVVGGWWTGSLALLADAGHMFSDMAALGISLWAAWVVHRKSSPQQTYGYRRAEILAALVNGGTLFLVAGGILHEAWDRWLSPPAIQGGPMMLIAVGGLVVNLLSLKVLHGGHNHNLNMRGAWLHVLGDTLGSVGVIVAAVFVWLLNWNWVDPVASALVCLLIGVSAGRLIWEAAGVLMEHAPEDIDVVRVRESILSGDGVQAVHCLHVWTISSGLRALSAHVVIYPESNASDVLNDLHQRLRSLFPLEHITLQLETECFTECTQGVECIRDPS